MSRLSSYRGITVLSSNAIPVKGNQDACRACHGVSGEGTVLSRMATTRTLECKDKDLPDCGDDRLITLDVGTPVSCGLCHENKLAER